YQVSGSASALPNASQAAMAPGTLEGKPAPDFALTDVNGVLHHLSDYRGKVVMLNFWATWCPPCRKELPEYGAFQTEYSTQGLQILGIALDDEGMAKVKPWLAAHPVNYPIMLPDEKVTAAYGDMASIPVTFIIDRKGIIRSSFVGIRKEDVVEGMFKPLLAEQ
ncbi:MAG TPA: TlpA disulfide reductase family protein, partial [Candidatus Kapabacteria bacterium]|nr:TlpA disulfide reductase family protein [Candidatus Kapabacteria bacterium]